jgi:hypothetical protein
MTKKIDIFHHTILENSGNKIQNCEFKNIFLKIYLKYFKYIFDFELES